MGLTEFFFLLFTKYGLNLLVTFSCQATSQDDSTSDCSKAVRVTSTHAGLKSLSQRTEALKHILRLRLVHSLRAGHFGIFLSNSETGHHWEEKK